MEADFTRELILGAIALGSVFIVMVAVIIILVTSKSIYECNECHNRQQLPIYAHVGTVRGTPFTAYLYCPHCQKKTWQKRK